MPVDRISELKYIVLFTNKLPTRTDTVFNSDTSTVYIMDTAFVFDTVIQIHNNYDTVNVYVYDTVSTVNNHYDTTYMIDTVLQVVNNYDTVTVTVTDTVQTAQCNPNAHTAVGALQYYSDPIVLEAIYNEFGYEDGWIFYLSTYQVALDNPAANIFDIYGYIDYWAPDWSGYYAFEYLWRLSFNGGDPANPTNWQMSDPPTGVAGYEPGLHRVNNYELLKPIN